LNIATVATYGGNTTVSAGTLDVTLTGGLPSSTNLTADAAAVFDNATQTVASLSGASTGSLVLNGTALTTSNGGTFNGAWNNGTSPSSITVSGGTMTFGGATASNGTVNANAATNFTGTTGGVTATRQLAALNIASGVTATITASTYPFTPTVLSPAAHTFADSTAKLNITNNEAILNEDLTTAVGRIISGQIFSTSSGGGIGSLALGPTQTEVRFTLLGDTNLDGKVDVTDLGNLASNYGATSGATWVQGDTNYNGAVDVSDLGNLASNYGGQLATSPSFGGGGSAEPAAMVASSLASVATVSSSAAVPEPASLGLIGLGAVGLLGRRRRRA
jgi:hypothetical protein